MQLVAGENHRMPSDTVKQRAIDALQTLPEDATIDDAIERLCLIAKIEEDSPHCLFPESALGPWALFLGPSRYHTLQSTSPPTPAFFAARPVITPRDVVRMLVPRPPSTIGTSSTPR